MQQIEKGLPKCPKQAQRIIGNALKAKVGVITALKTMEAVLAGDGKFELDLLRRRAINQREVFGSN